MLLSTLLFGKGTNNSGFGGRPSLWKLLTCVYLILAIYILHVYLKFIFDLRCTFNIYIDFDIIVHIYYAFSYQVIFVIVLFIKCIEKLCQWFILLMTSLFLN